MKKKYPKHQLRINPLSWVILLAIPFLLSVNVFGQFDPIYRNFTVNDGLAGNETYHVFQDSKGFIWIATNNGVSLFDGNNFKNFDIQSGLVDNIIFEVYEDFNGRIWFISFSGALSYYENGKIKAYPFNDKIRQNMPANSKGPMKSSFYIDSLNSIYLGIRNYGIMHISPEGVFKKIDGLYTEGEVVLFEPCKNKILVSNPEKPLNHDFIIKSGVKVYRYKLKDISKTEASPNLVFAIRTNDSHVVTSIEGSLVMLQNGKVKWTNSSLSSIIWVSKNDEYLMVSDIDGGLFLSPIGNQNSFSPIKILGNYQITSTLKDKEGGYWLSTLNNGIIYIPDIHIQSITTQNGLSDPRVKAVYTEKNRIYLGYQMGNIDLIENGKVRKINLTPDSGNASFVRSFLLDKENNKFWTCSFGHLSYMKNDVFHIIQYKNTIYPRKIVKSNKSDTYWLATANGIMKIQNDRVVYSSQDDGFKAMALAIAVDKNESVWFLTFNGLWKYSNSVFQYMGEENPLLAIVGSSLYYNPTDETLWIGSNGAGIVILDKNGKTTQITTQDGLVSNSITNIIIHKDKVWVGTRQGLSILQKKEKRYSIQNLTNKDGLISNDISALYVNDTATFIGTSNGLSIIKTKLLKQNLTPPATHILSVQFEDSTLTNPSDTIIKLPYDIKFAIINYSGLTYRNMGEIPYRYRLMGLDSNWVYTKSIQCLYSVFKPGTYRFEVQSQNSGGIWGPSAILNFIVTSPYWQKIWFIVLFTGLIAVIIYTIYHIRMTELKRRNELINNINLYKQQSLRQQMNPHFIFNTLNSIQYYILEKDTISSHKYLTKFARLMRITLDNSLHSAIPLRDELDALRLYLELEALRLEGKFTYSIDYGGEESILETKIPTLMIQPFVENAIWHGIMLKSNKTGHVQITIRNTDTMVLCTIEDNGVGRDESRKIRESTNKVHKSMGFQITQQRIDLLNSMYGQKFNIKVTDLYDSNEKPMGTRVSISIPKDINVA